MKTVTFRNGVTKTFSLIDSKSRMDYLLALQVTLHAGDTQVADLLWQWIAQGLIDRREFRRYCLAAIKDR
jgi:hypothetical protein